MKNVFVGVLSVVVSSSAWAQLPPFTRATAPYQPLNGATPLSVGTFTDEGIAAIALPFGFPFNGASYQTVYAQVNGQVLLTLPLSCQPFSGNCVTYTNITPIPSSTGSVANHISAMWQDLEVQATTQIRVLSTPSKVTIEWANIAEYGSTPDFLANFQISLEPSGNFSIHYGPITGSSASYVAGYQAGGLGFAVAGAGCTPSTQSACCGASAAGASTRCAHATYVPDTLITTEPPVQPDLIAQAIRVSNFQTILPSNDLSMTVTLRALNFSRTAANNWNWRAYLSRDPVRDPADGGPGLLDGGSGANDIPLTPELTGNALAAGGANEFTGVVTTSAPPPPGDYYVIAELDSQNTIAEASETNNLVVLPYAITGGTDMVATAITGAPLTGPDSTDSVRLQYFNRGGTAPGTISYRVMLSPARDAGLFLFADGGSTDVLADGGFEVLPDGGVGRGILSAPIIHRGTRVITGGETVDESISVTMPPDAPQGDFFYALQIDPTGAVQEANKRNNIVFSTARVEVKRVDLLFEALEVIDPLSRVPVRTVLFGGDYKAVVRFRNQGGGAARNFRIGVVLSNDSNLSLLSDVLMNESIVAQAQASPTSTVVEIPFTLPVVDRADAGLPGGNYYIFVSLDSLGTVVESNKGNNAGNIGPISALAPAPDYALSTLQAPAGAGTNEVIPVFRTVRNIGNRPGPMTSYRYYASANTIISNTDAPLAIQLPDGGTSLSAELMLGVGAADSRTELVKLPANLTTGTYYVGCLVDPDNTITELSKTNNGIASNTVQVVQSALRIIDVQLPDATVGRPYLYTLSASGELGPSTWAAVNPAELPDGLTLSSEGQLSGSPSGRGGTGARSFTASVTNDNRTAIARVVFRLMPATSQVEITSTSIPAIVNSTSTVVNFPLGAAGGSRPYVWRVAQGVLPSQLTFNAAGVLSGSPRSSTPDATTNITFEVRDATGGSARRQLQLRLVAAGSIVLKTTRLPDAVTGQDYPPTEIAVQNADGSALARPIRFDVSGSLPPGLASQEEFGVFTISGRPTRAGTYTFSISVEDMRGRTDSLDYTVTVYTNRFRIVASNLPQILRPTEAVAGTFSVQPTAAVTWSIVAGRLPAGVTLNAGTGALEGSIEDLEDSVGTHTFVVQAKDESGASGLAPFALVVERAPKKMGCNASGSGPLSALLLAAFFFFRGRRRLAPVLAVATVALPLVGFAQTYQVSTPTTLTYTPLPAGRTVVLPTTSAGTTVTLPFTFQFYGMPYTQVVMSRFGYLALAGSSSTDSFNDPVPNNSTFGPQTIIAPWWDSLNQPTGTSANFAWTVTGSAPNRVVIFEWRDMGAATTTPVANRFAFQAHLFETTNMIRFSYAASMPPALSGSVGIQGSRSVGVAGLPCAASGMCAATDWPANQAIEFFFPADLKVSRLAADQTGYSGVRYGATAFVRNDGGRIANNVTVRFFLSSDAVIDMSDLTIGDAMATTLPVGQETAVPLPGNLPPAAMVGNYFVIVQVDPDNSVPETDETNNASAPVSMAVAAPRADLAVTQVTAPASAMPGGMVMVGRTISNQGNSPAPAFKYTYLLSDNDVISISDRALSPTGDITGLAPNATDATPQSVALPANLAPGTYWVGVCVNFDGANATSPFPVDEISVVNNCSVAAAGTVVTTGTLTVLTTSLPGGTQYAPYGVRLRAAGGTGAVTWEITAGALPAGMSMGPDGLITGAPARTGAFAFEATATSGTITAKQMLSLMVSQGSLPLVIVDQDLPGAEFARIYSAGLVAVGGKPPYRWALRPNAALPEGLALSSDGFLEGRATESGEKTFEVEVTDSSDARVVRELKVRVVNPTTLSIGTTALVRGALRQSYLQRLVVVGGRAPYQWTVTRFQQLPQNPTEAPGPVQMGLPENFGLAIQDGVNEDFIAGTPKQSGLFSLTLKVVDGAGTEDSVSLTLLVGYVEALAVTTILLPDAFVNQSYAIKLSHNGGREANVAFSLPCVRQATRPDQFDCVPNDATQTLPAGLSLGSDGSLLGIPSGEPGTYTFLVKVADDGGRQDVRGLSIRLRPDFASGNSSGGGCTAGGIEPTVLGALLGVLTLLKRRR